jgi:hypothetical protein
LTLAANFLLAPVNDVVDIGGASGLANIFAKFQKNLK